MNELEMRRKLEEGWEWMKRNPNHSRLDDFFNDKWTPLLRRYEESFGFDDQKDDISQQMAFDVPEGVTPKKERLQS